MEMPSPCTAPELIESQERNSRFGRRGRSGAPKRRLLSHHRAKLVIQAVSMRGLPVRLSSRPTTPIRLAWTVNKLGSSATCSKSTHYGRAQLLGCYRNHHPFTQLFSIAPTILLLVPQFYPAQRTMQLLASLMGEQRAQACEKACLQQLTARLCGLLHNVVA